MKDLLIDLVKLGVSLELNHGTTRYLIMREIGGDYSLGKYSSISNTMSCSEAKMLDRMSLRRHIMWNMLEQMEVYLYVDGEKAEAKFKML